MSSLSGKIALVTGASRGIGASVARMLADRGADIVINYHSKASRAESAAADVRAVGRRALLTQADLTKADEVTAMIEAVRREYGRLDVLVLNASGGLEKDKPADYAMQLNLIAQVRLVDTAIPLMPRGGRIVFVTSHMAHFHGERPIGGPYEPVAASK
jgi:NAD(P)-dependent dehydrogenase (short-subunit alcohol dehydrogenase family)